MVVEGGLFAWKVQKLNLAPTLSYDKIQRPLKAPKGKTWIFDPVHKEWSLVNKEKENFKLVDASNAVEDANGNLLTPHHISPSDTFQGICLRYKIKPLELRRANGGFTGTNLNLVPNPLMIPLKNVVDSKAIAEVKPLSQTEVVGLLLKECRGMARSEARAYLMLTDWDLAQAIENSREDGF
mmetsp:Transcript_19198/g.39494  ORF Transcript_19198/g.39494 Transcript_19198/m.39494 type:complete len:182 (+) Transcript_19198:105-650(+)